MHVVVGILFNTFFSLLWSCFFIDPSLIRLPHTKNHAFIRPLGLSICINWLLFFGPINLFSYFLKTSLQTEYSWVIDRSAFGISMAYSFIAYNVILVMVVILNRSLVPFLPIISHAVRGTLPKISVMQTLFLSIFIFLISIFVSPNYGMASAAHGAWILNVPLLLRPFAKGLFLMEFIPTVAILINSCDGHRRDNKKLFMYLVIFVFQFLTFGLLKQRFYSILVAFALIFMLIRFGLNRIYLALTLMLAPISYAVPTALRYGRPEAKCTLRFFDCLKDSWGSTLLGLQSKNILDSLANDLSYNKSGHASLSVIAGMRDSGLINNTDYLGWVFSDIYRPLPALIKPMFANFHSYHSESIVSKVLGIGLPGWQHSSIHPSLLNGYVADMMETPLMDPVANGGLNGLMIFSILIPICLVLIWSIFFYFSSKFYYLWFVPYGLLIIIGLNGSWLGEILVFLKILFPWLIYSYFMFTFPRFVNPNRYI